MLSNIVYGGSFSSILFSPKKEKEKKNLGLYWACAEPSLLVSCSANHGPIRFDRAEFGRTSI